MISYRLEFDAHNQYLSVAIKHGLLGLLIFIAMFIYFIKLAVSSNDFIYFSLTLVLLIGFFTEDIMESNKGIFYFAFFNTLFGYQILYARTKKIAAKSDQQDIL
jgi:O-antigen ligase